MPATCTRPICRCSTPTRWPIRCWRRLWVGASCVIQPRFSASRFWNVALEHGCTWTSTIPFCMKALLEHEIPKDHKFRLWGTAVNEPPPFAAFGVKIIGWWGMTETITHGIVGEVDQPNTPMSIGRAAPEYHDPHHRGRRRADRSRRHRQSPDQGHSRACRCLRNICTTKRPRAKALTSTAISSPATASRCSKTASSVSATAPRTCSRSAARTSRPPRSSR